MLLAEILQNRADDDIPLDQFFDYQQYDGQTLDYPDEIYEDTDNEGDLLITYVKSFFLQKIVFITLFLDQSQTNRQKLFLLFHVLQIIKIFIETSRMEQLFPNH